MKRQYRTIDTDRVDWTIEIYHDGELVATEKFYDADEFDDDEIPDIRKVADNHYIINT